MIVVDNCKTKNFVIDNQQIFPIVIDYNKQPAQMVNEIPITWCVVPFPYKKIRISGKGIKNTNCFYVTVGKEGASFKQVVTFCAEKKIHLAKAEHLFAFGKSYPEEYNEKIGNNKVIAGGSAWLDSHECITEMLALSWDTFYHDPGSNLSVVNDLGFELNFNDNQRKKAFTAGDRFLAIKE